MMIQACSEPRRILNQVSHLWNEAPVPIETQVAREHENKRQPQQIVKLSGCCPRCNSSSERCWNTNRVHRSRDASGSGAFARSAERKACTNKRRAIVYDRSSGRAAREGNPRRWFDRSILVVLASSTRSINRATRALRNVPAVMNVSCTSTYCVIDRRIRDPVLGNGLD